MMAELRNELPDLNPSSMLDFGSGPGTAALAVWDVWGLEGGNVTDEHGQERWEAGGAAAYSSSCMTRNTYGVFATSQPSLRLPPFINGSVVVCDFLVRHVRDALLRPYRDGVRTYVELLWKSPLPFVTVFSRVSYSVIGIRYVVVRDMCFISCCCSSFEIF